MSEWNVKAGQPVDPATTRKIAKEIWKGLVYFARKIAKEIWKGLVYFAILKTHDPKKKAALERLTELRLEVQEQLDVLAPGYLE